MITLRKVSPSRQLTGKNQPRSAAGAGRIFTGELWAGGDFSGGDFIMEKDFFMGSAIF